MAGWSTKTPWVIPINPTRPKTQTVPFKPSLIAYPSLKSLASQAHLVSHFSSSSSSVYIWFSFWCARWSILLILFFLFQVLELKTGDFVRDAIQLLHEKNIFGAPILDPVTAPERFLNRYIGVIDFASMFLWSIEVIFLLNNHSFPNWDFLGPLLLAGSFVFFFFKKQVNIHIASFPLQEYEKGDVETEGNSNDEKWEGSFFTILGRNPQIGQTMVLSSFFFIHFCTRSWFT